MSHENQFWLRGLRRPFARNCGDRQPFRASRCMPIKKIGSLLVQINHPQVIRTLLLVADKNKPSLQRVQYHKNFPCDARRTGRTAGVNTEPPARPGYPIIEDKSRLHSKKHAMNTGVRCYRR